MIKEWSIYPDFDEEEFDSPDVVGSGSRMQPHTMHKLQHARVLAGIIFTINSGVRTPEHNANVGGSPTSSHLDGCAVDIACTTSSQRIAIVKSCIEAGFTRIGIGRNFVHVDDDPTKAPSMWHYYK